MWNWFKKVYGNVLSNGIPAQWETNKDVEQFEKVARSNNWRTLVKGRDDDFFTSYIMDMTKSVDYDRLLEFKGIDEDEFTGVSLYVYLLDDLTGGLCVYGLTEGRFLVKYLDYNDKEDRDVYILSSSSKELIEDVKNTFAFYYFMEDCCA